MPTDDFHKLPFDEGTVLKLDILTKYLEEWLPVFLQQGYIRQINIFDFQCGPGRDVKGVEGSPLRILRALARARPNVGGLSVPIDAFFNDVSRKKIQQLQSELSCCGLESAGKCHLSTQSFEDCFAASMPRMMESNTANFLFIDPTGLVRVEWMIEQLSRLKFTDFLIFVPSADLYRFSKKEEFQNFFPRLSFTGSLVDASREICAYMRCKLADAGEQYYLAQFAIRKERTARINSLVFGSRSLFGLYKFLKVSWAESPNGEANYDLCGDILCAKQLALPFIDKTPKKLCTFNDDIRQKVLDGFLKTNRDVAEYSLVNGFLPTHAKAALKNMKARGELGHVPAMGYDSVIKSGKVEHLVLLGK